MPKRPSANFSRSIALLALWLSLSTTAQAQEGWIGATLDSLTVHDSRVAGYSGCARAADFVERELRLTGLADVRREEFSVVVPMDRGGRIWVAESGEEFQLWGLWPNQVRTPTLPEAGLMAPMVWFCEMEYSRDALEPA